MVGAQKKFTDLAGSTEAQGDLKSVVLHNLTCSAQKSTFPFALGVKISAVDSETFSSTGDAYSMITMPNSSSTTAITLQEDDTALAYEFARKFPGVHHHPFQTRFRLSTRFRSL